MPAIFISYRREDSIAYSGRLYDRLIAEFGKGQVFMDIDSIDPGADFIEVIERTVASCDAVLVVIGKQWLTVADAHGRRRIENAEDFVRLEVETALSRKVRVVPVLVGGAQMPRSDELPATLEGLTRRHALDLPDVAFHQTLERLIHSLRRDAAPFVQDKQSAATAETPCEYFCYISRDKIDQLFPNDADEDPTSITAIPELQPLLVETISYGRPDLLQRERSLKREYVRKLQCFLRTHAQDIRPFHAESTPPALCWARAEFRVEEIDQDALMASLVSTGATKLALHCSLANFSNRCTDGERFQPNSTNYGFFKQRLPITLETVFYLTSRDGESTYGSPLFLKLPLQSGINL